jgi:membrane protein YqaA with SNARE-associated domain
MTPWEAVRAIAASFGVCFSASLLPVGGGSEVYVLATSALLPTVFVAPLVLASAAGSVAAKVLVYLGASHTVSLPRFLRFLQRKASSKLATRIQEGPWIRRGLILISATVSVPPFFAIALTAGTLKTPLRELIVVGFVGQSIHFGAVWALPQVVSFFAGLA